MTSPRTPTTTTGWTPPQDPQGRDTTAAPGPRPVPISNDLEGIPLLRVKRKEPKKGKDAAARAHDRAAREIINYNGRQMNTNQLECNLAHWNKS